MGLRRGHPVEPDGDGIAEAADEVVASVMGVAQASGPGGGANGRGGPVSQRMDMV